MTTCQSKKIATKKMYSKYICLFLAVFGTAFALDPIQVVTKLGPIAGQTLTSPYENLPVHRFLSIPYAKPPIGSLRFRRPVPLDTKWTEPLDATHFPSQCIQDTKMALSPFNTPFLLNRNFTEDCLYLNVWSPDVEPKSEDNLKPVLVWIHGGGLTIGSSSFDLWDGEVLATKADAVVVTINYRVSTLGFLYSDVPDIKGNQGLWDQAAALEWVQDNIRYFGGDPKQVTIMGQSAGGWSVSLQILSPVSRNLFQNAIMMSGAIQDNVIEPEAFTEQYLTAIRKVDCATADDKTISKEVVECLQELPAEKVDAIYNFVDRKKPIDLLPLVVIDGQFLPAHPRKMLADKNYKTNVNLLSSIVEDEASFIMALIAGLPQFAPKNPQPLNLQEAQGFLSYVAGHQPLQELLHKFYFNGLNPNLDNSNALRKRVGIAYGDKILACPTLEFSKQVFQNSPESAKVYQWYYTAKLGNLKFLCNDWAGACHCDELYPAFGMPFRYPEKYTGREKEISNEVINLIASFLRTGKPGVDQPEWEPYFLAKSGESKVVAPYYEINNLMKKPENFKFNLKDLECELLWG